MQQAILWGTRLAIFMLMYFGNRMLMDGDTAMGAGLMIAAGVVGVIGVRKNGRL